MIQAGAEQVTGDLRDRPSLDQACRGVETVITTATATARDFDLQAIDLDGTKNMIDAAKSAGVSHFIYTSANGKSLDNPNPVMQTKALCEQYLQESGLSYTILSPGVFTEIWVGMVVGIPLQAGQPVTLVGQGDHRHSFVAIEDIAEFAVAAADRPAKNQDIIIGGPASYSWSEIVQAVGRVSGADLQVNYIAPGQPVPLLHPGVGDMLTSMEFYESIIDMTETAPAYGVTLTSLETSLRRMFTPAAS